VKITGATERYLKSGNGTFKQAAAPRAQEFAGSVGASKADP
jgi:hypothetical protein